MVLRRWVGVSGEQGEKGQWREQVLHLEEMWHLSSLLVTRRACPSLVRGVHRQPLPTVVLLSVGALPASAAGITCSHLLLICPENLSPRRGLSTTGMGLLHLGPNQRSPALSRPLEAPAKPTGPGRSLPHTVFLAVLRLCSSAARIEKPLVRPQSCLAYCLLKGFKEFHCGV